LLRRAHQHSGVPLIFYFHPWELDPGQPRISGVNARTRFRHYVNLDRFESRLKVLLESFKWGRVDDVFIGRDPGEAQ
jgi:hypothetical protein